MRKLINYRIMKANNVYFSSVYNFISDLFSQFGAEAALVGGLVRDLVQASTEAEDSEGVLWDYFDPKDFDVIWFKPGCGPEDLANFLRETGLGSAIVVEEEFGVVKFKIKLQIDGKNVDISIDAVIPRLESYGDDSRRPEIEAVQAKSLKGAIKVDFKRRDFRCNALYLPLGLKMEVIVLFDGFLNYGAILDPSNGGIRDITGTVYDEPVIDPETGVETGEVIPTRIGAKTLNWVNNPKTTTEDDPIRVLRGIGFLFRKGFHLSGEAEKGLKENLYIFINSIGTKKCSWNKIKDELNKVFNKAKGIAVSRYLRRLHDLGILKHILPEVDDMWDFDQKNPHHSKTLHWHTLDAVVSALNLFDEDGEKYFSQRADLDDDTISLGHYATDCTTPLRAMVVWSILFHDCAKCSKEEEYACQTFDECGIAHYHHHAEKSAEMAKKRLATLTLSGKEIEIICHLITNHMCLKDSGWDSEEIISTSTIKRKRRDNFILNHGDTHVDIQRLSLCIIYGDDLNHKESTDKKVRGFESRWNEYISTRKPEPKIDVDGKYLMDRYGLQPGPEVGKLKRELEDFSLEVDATDFPELCDKWDKR
jgi:tRNA nucleotidyltransferase/poly(A) polymerase